MIKKHFSILLTVLLLISFLSFQPKKEWTSLLDKNLSQWETYLSFSPNIHYKGDNPLDDQGKIPVPIGYNKNIKNVFSVKQENGVPILRISGEIYGCIFTKQEFKNYHLRLKVKFGNKKWVPRLNEDMDSGILYNSQGPCGVDYWRSWMMSQEFQIIEKSMGDYWCIGKSNINIKAKKKGEQYIYDQNSTPSSFGYNSESGNFCQAAGNFAHPNGEWNTLELISIEDKSLHIVNGKVAMALSGSNYADSTGSKALIGGKIQLQSEAAEVFFKEVEIKYIDKIPESYLSYFQ